jgi:hypothetical protein
MTNLGKFRIRVAVTRRSASSRCLALGLGLIHTDLAAVDFTPVQLSDGLQCTFLVHGDEAEPPGRSGGGILRQVAIVNGPELRERVNQGVRNRVERQVANV